MVEQLRKILGCGEDIELEHAVRIGFGGVHDDVWIPKIAAEGWIVITGDSGRQSKPGKGKLPLVCKEWRVTFAACSPSIVNYDSSRKLRLLLDVWDNLVALKDAPRGSAIPFASPPVGRPSY